MIGNNLYSPIFIGGCPRSGTTMLGSILGQSNECFTTPESQFKFYLLEQNDLDNLLLQKLLKDFRLKLWQLEEHLLKDELNSLYGKPTKEVLNKILFVFNNKSVAQNFWIDHTPDNLHYFRLLKEKYQNAKFIYIIRDPRSVYASVKRLDWGPNTPVSFINWWRKNISIGLTALSENSRLLVVKYEDIILNPQEKIFEICNWIGINYEETLLIGNNSFLPRYTQSQHELVGKNLDKNAISKYKQIITQHEIQYIEYNLKSEMQNLGYMELNEKFSSQVNQLIKLEWKIKEYIAVYFNQRKMNKKQKKSVN